MAAKQLLIASEVLNRTRARQLSNAELMALRVTGVGEPLQMAMKAKCGAEAAVSPVVSFDERAIISTSFFALTNAIWNVGYKAKQIWPTLPSELLMEFKVSGADVTFPTNGSIRNLSEWTDGFNSPLVTFKKGTEEIPHDEVLGLEPCKQGFCFR